MKYNSKKGNNLQRCSKMISEKKCLELLHEKFHPEEIAKYEKKIKRDYGSAYNEYCNELSKIVKQYGLGEDITIEICRVFYHPDIKFRVKAPYKIDFNEEGEYIEKIQEHMSEFSKKNGLYEFFMNAYISID